MVFKCDIAVCEYLLHHFYLTINLIIAAAFTKTFSGTSLSIYKCTTDSIYQNNQFPDDLRKDSIRVVPVMRKKLQSLRESDTTEVGMRLRQTLDYLIIRFVLMQSLERCQRKDSVASKPEKLDSLGIENSFHFLSAYQYIGETYSSDVNNCGTALQCLECNSQSRCTRVRTASPISKVMELPFNQYSWLTTHNSFASRVANLSINSQISSVTNQEDSIIDQLHNGVRGLMLDMHDYHGDIWLCHGPCTIFTAFQPAIHVLKEINVFLTQHRNEIVTVFIKDHVTSPNGINKLYHFGKEESREYRIPFLKSVCDPVSLTFKMPIIFQESRERLRF
ncbi:uncharacterized protein LOC131640983 [Vicia villosa]|uniref:uncharacterized protein LOC131640983 n=1 Tax=Vicia villosa TaxID=3911 RepID=UPI00273C7E65|nr:uncharacterized protein LOC131640983 [Vicia villosa]